MIGRPQFSCEILFKVKIFKMINIRPKTDTNESIKVCEQKSPTFGPRKKAEDELHIICLSLESVLSENKPNSKVRMNNAIASQILKSPRTFLLKI